LKLLAEKNKRKFAVGDLVQFDISRILGIVTDVKIAAAFSPLEEILDVQVRWIDGEEFWCLEFTLKLISSI
jgi:heat shock protein HspQ